MKKYFLFSFFCVFFSFSVFAQKSSQNSILTASDFFQQLSDNYAKINQYEAKVKIVASKTPMEGQVSFKKPSMLRIDFSDPEDQVILYNGTELLIYIPRTSAILRQSVVNDTETNATTLVTPQGLSLLSRYYSVSYENGPQAEPIDADNPKSEKVIKLVLTRKNNSESFKTMNIAVNPKTLLISRISAVTTSDSEFSFDFSDYVINGDIPDARFMYDTPPTANEYNNFLFTE